MDVTMMNVVAAGGGLVVGACVGYVMAGLLAAGKMDELEDQLAEAKYNEQNWHDSWRRVHNNFLALKTACRKVHVPKRGPGGKIVGKQTVLELIEKEARDV